MIRTQIQLPEELYRAVKEFAEQKEWSLAEVVRRGLEDLLCRYPGKKKAGVEWELPEPRSLGGDAFFSDPDWRYEANQPTVVRETREGYGTRKRGKKR
jgi:hypothetical protein